LTKVTISDKNGEPSSNVGTEIKWKEGKNVTKKTVKKTQKNKKSGAKRVVTKEEDDESFFRLFGTVNIEGEEADKLEDEEFQKLEDRLNIDFDLSDTIKNAILPYSLEYYFGLIKEEDYGDYEDEDLEGDEGDLDEDMDDEIEEKPAKKDKKNK
jgi:nucleosome assembly protein 1-like 1